MFSNPKKLFLIDSLGALITALLLSQVLARFQSTFGMPTQILYLLATIAAVFAVYSFTCYRLVKENWRPFLKAIAMANFAYCLLSIWFIISYAEELTTLGWFYFLGEIGVILGLVRLEWALVRGGVT